MLILLDSLLQEKYSLPSEDGGGGGDV